VPPEFDFFYQLYVNLQVSWCETTKIYLY